MENSKYVDASCSNGAGDTNIEKNENNNDGASTAGVDEDKDANTVSSACITGKNEDENIGDRFCNVVTHGVGETTRK